MTTFNECVLNWWYSYLSDTDDATIEALLGNHLSENDSPKDMANPREWLEANVTDADEIYNRYFGFGDVKFRPKDMPTGPDFIYQMLKENAGWYSERFDYQAGTVPSFAEEFLRDMTEHIVEYEQPKDFFEALARHGCQSGMVGMFVYNSDCKDFYIKHMDDMDEYEEQIFEEVGYSNGLRQLLRYVRICWMCYEEFAYQIARALYPDDF